MQHYRAYLLDKHRRVIGTANLYCADEQAAKESPAISWHQRRRAMATWSPDSGLQIW